MCGKIHILFPIYFDHWAAVNTVHREVARRLPDDFHTTALIGNGSYDIVESEYNNIIEIPNNINDIRRLINYITVYADKFDLVQTWGGKSDHLARLSKLRGAKIIHTMHSGFPSVVRQKRTFQKRADQVIAVSEYVKRIGKNQSDLVDIKVIPNGIDLNQFHPNIMDTKSGLISYVGKNGSNRNPDLVFDIARQSPELDFAVLGPGFSPDEVNIDKPSNLYCLPKIDRACVAEQFASSEIVLAPYEKQAFCMTALESMATDTPVVGLARGNLPDLITEASGILLDSTQTRRWKMEIKRIRQDKYKLEPRKTAKKYQWKKIASEYEKIYRSLL